MRRLCVCLVRARALIRLFRATVCVCDGGCVSVCMFAVYVVGIRAELVYNGHTYTHTINHRCTVGNVFLETIMSSMPRISIQASVPLYWLPSERDGMV